MPDTSKTVRETPLLNSVFVNVKRSHEVSESILKVKLDLYFTPYDFTKYSFDESVRDADYLYWIIAVMYNYIPFALCKAEHPGRYTSFDQNEFKEVDTNWSIEQSTYTPKENIIISDLKECAQRVFGKNEADAWFTSMPGQQFAFNYAIPGSLYFDKTTPISGFKNLIHDPERYKEYLNWTNSTGNNSVTLVTEYDISELGDDEYTFVIVSANPSAQLLFTYFFTINQSNKKDKEFKLDIDPSSFYFYDSKAKTYIDNINASDKNIYVKLKSKDKSNVWSSTRPRIQFKVKKTYE